MRGVILSLVLACDSGARRPPPAAIPPSNAAPTVATAPTPTCVGADFGFTQARIDAGGVVACYAMQQGAEDECWRFDLASHVWSFTTRQPHADQPAAPAQVTATAARASVCRRDGSDCVTVPLSGIQVRPDETIAGATNGDRSIVAVWGLGPVHVFDADGKRLATIKPWPTGMNGSDPSVFRSAHVLGSVLEVRIADTPISSSIRLYDARSGKKIGDVFGGKPMDDEVEPIELGGTDYAFMTVDDRSILVVDVATGRQRARYPLGDVTLSPAVIARVGAGLAGVIATTAFVVDANGKMSTGTVPACLK